jgi:lysylphosphatidylglycerol synthetase-like protein (DUF2156 family)
MRKAVAVALGGYVGLFVLLFAARLLGKTTPSADWFVGDFTALLAVVLVTATGVLMFVAIAATLHFSWVFFLRSKGYIKPKVNRDV